MASLRKPGALAILASLGPLHIDAFGHVGIVPTQQTVYVVAPTLQLLTIP